MQRDDDRIRGGSGTCDEWKELSCRNCAHLGIFDSAAGLNKAKGDLQKIRSPNFKIRNKGENNENPNKGTGQK